MKNLGLLNFFLDMQVFRDSYVLNLRQSKYILDVLHHAKMFGAKPYTVLCVAREKISSTSGDPLENITEYRQIIGALQYCSLTRPKIAYFVNQLCQHLHSPTTEHFLHYLKGTIDHGLYYTHVSLCHTNSVWAGDLMITDIPPTMESFLEIVWSRGVPRSNLLFPDQVQRLNIALLQ